MAPPFNFTCGAYNYTCLYIPHPLPEKKEENKVNKRLAKKNKPTFANYTQTKQKQTTSSCSSEPFTIKAQYVIFPLTCTIGKRSPVARLRD